MTSSPSRAEPPQIAGEKTSLSGYLDFHRATLERKCAGLTADQLRDRPVTPSRLSLLGIMRHLADTERLWIANRYGSLDLPPLYFSAENPDGDFEDLNTADPSAVLATWREACDLSRDIVSAASLDDLGVRADGTSVTLRWIVLRVLEEYARHNGHADLLRESLDGSTGA
ncbi:DinB family protein [Longispora sp. NPDC051575]|uniref:DinB family protein n=1 Tax=Longispora sp. NPDC051575 TaxID=3154943 RepID=UPI003435B4F8